ncbi:hypothetical protein PUR28_08715 [Streptomyces sp. BE308]|uniref:hypothetical protein n=1 Tax=Streptomyces sp. BE308 TaxID=3002529 RepID=UPI002E7A8C39|nr:hypothetical protein [Streptomyces sp. BE308]MEE1790847.1 hypothetical protein [Streptomyces sp. BE308]
MDANDLQRPASCLRKQGLRVATLEPGPRIRSADPMRGMPTEEIVAVGATYVTGFAYVIGEACG